MRKSVSFFFPIILCLLLTTAAIAEMRIVTAEEPPTNYILDGKFTGTTTDIVEAMRDSVGSSAKIENRPWANSYNIAKTKPNVLIFTCGRTQERIDHGFHFIGPVITRKHVLWARKGSGYKITGAQDIIDQGLKLGGVRGDWRSKFFIEKGAEVDQVNTHNINLKKLLKNRIDLMISSDIEAPSVVKAEGVSMDDIEIAFIIKEASSYIMISKDTPQETVEKWRGAYAGLQNTDFFNQTAAKWTGILGFALGYKNDLGFFIK